MDKKVLFILYSVKRYSPLFYGFYANQPQSRSGYQVIISCPSSSRPTLVINCSVFLHIDCYGFKTFQLSRPNQNIAKLIGVMHMEVDQVVDMMMDMEVDKVADMVMKILFRTK